MSWAAGPWVAELGRTLPGLVRSHRPGGPLPAATRERVIVAVAEVNGSRSCAWVHGGWGSFVGADEPTDDEVAATEALLEYARACARAGHPLPPGPLAETVPALTVQVVRATVARAELASRVGVTVEALLARRLPAARDLALAAVAAPFVVPVAAAAGVLRLVARNAPPTPVVGLPAEGANLLAAVLAETIPLYLRNAAVRSALLGMPVTASVAVRSGRSAATVRVGRGAVAVDNGVQPDAWVVVEGDVEPLLRAASGTLARELGGLRIRPS